jgi:hypothetical protein
MSVPMRKEWIAPQEDVFRSPCVRPRKSRRRALKPGVAIAALLLISLVASVRARPPWNRPDAPTLRLLPTSSESAKVTLNAAHIERNLGFVTVTGNAMNRTSSSLARVEAMVELLDAQNQTLCLESALVPFNPMPAGRNTPFQVHLPDDSRAVAYRVWFKQLAGPSLN